MASPKPDAKAPYARKDFPYFSTIQTRWNDNDLYGHINNAVYYTYFDTVVNGFLIEKGLLQLGQAQTIGLVVETLCQYFAPLAYPDSIDAGLRTRKIGTSSVTYEIALFKKGCDTAAAQGHFVHVYVDEKTRKPTPLSNQMRSLLHQLEAPK